MTNYAALDETRLRDVAQALLDVLVDAAEGAGWVDPTNQLTLVRPGAGCDSISVWVDSIVPQVVGGGPCSVVPQVVLRYAIAVCMGADEIESAGWWAERADFLDRVWGTIGGLHVASADGTLCAALGVACDEVALTRSDRFDSADLFVWEGAVVLTLGVSTLG